MPAKPQAQPGTIRLVAGLGNPGDEYANTRHNAGFRAIDVLGERLGAGYWKSQCGAEVAIVRVRGEEGPREVVLAKPQSYMNTSGGPISKLCAEYHVTPDEVLVIHDELDLDPGVVRVKFGGGHAGHNGLKSIINKLGTKNFSRIRVGIGMPPGRMPVVDWVLKEYRTGEMEDVRLAAVDAADAVETCLERGVIFARDHINGAGKPGSR
ncbi:MAG: aminoacyl-tRNA hydrolase [Parolsenella sp.]|uniref:aminoacyl-tRNA hydrolase n=1 Tax=Parolsenella sp. TaxID=2083006 RepID=UPI002A74AB70|nr:aminoacyl-tRNA hydrolase [Parolsenella sp.]MDY3292837.1 aminoacyl-tRNA hydrolase [Parolsenella sp.]